MNETNCKLRRVVAAIAAIALAAVLYLGGTFAWQSIGQQALNESSDVVNPGGRLHDDFNGINKDVYVENFADEPIYARVRLDEYFEITQEGSGKTTVVTPGAEKDNHSTWETHRFGDLESSNSTANYWKWEMGGQTVYMPTFNKNKDSLKADINGTYLGTDGVVTDRIDDDRYLDYKEYSEDETDTALATYDADIDNLDNNGIVREQEETHTAKPTADAEVITMAEWLASDIKTGSFWVCDTDGWCYWAQPIEPHTATGLLLSGIELTQVMDDSWYYAIRVVAQFITADDLGMKDHTGFYADNQIVSNDALDLLLAIGVDVFDTKNDE